MSEGRFYYDLTDFNNNTSMSWSGDIDVCNPVESSETYLHTNKQRRHGRSRPVCHSRNTPSRSPDSPSPPTCSATPPNAEDLLGRVSK